MDHLSDAPHRPSPHLPLSVLLQALAPVGDICSLTRITLFQVFPLSEIFRSWNVEGNAITFPANHRDYNR